MAQTPQAPAKRLLMARPDFFRIDYEINPWMDVDNPVESGLAGRQWAAIRQIYDKLGWSVELIDPDPDWPDLVFTANGGLAIGDKALVANFRHPDRRGEAALFADWFRSRRFDTHQARYNFEGEGDALVWNNLILAGYPWRSDAAAHPHLARLFDREVLSLQLADARFYHLDTCLTPIDDQTVAIYKPAFNREAYRRLKDRVPDLIEVAAADAEAYGLNALSDGQNVILAAEAEDLGQLYQSRGLTVWPTPISEFKKSGGGVKCLTLELHPAGAGA